MAIKTSMSVMIIMNTDDYTVFIRPLRAAKRGQRLQTRMQRLGIHSNTVTRILSKPAVQELVAELRASVAVAPKRSLRQPEDRANGTAGESGDLLFMNAATLARYEALEATRPFRVEMIRELRRAQQPWPEPGVEQPEQGRKPLGE